MGLLSLTQVQFCILSYHFTIYPIHSGHGRLSVSFPEYVVNFHVPICFTSQILFIWDTLYSLSSLQINCPIYLSIRPCLIHWHSTRA